MKKGVIIAVIALTTSLAVFAGVRGKNATEKAKVECCDKTNCCPDGTNKEDCCETNCE